MPSVFPECEVSTLTRFSSVVNIPAVILVNPFDGSWLKKSLEKLLSPSVVTCLETVKSLELDGSPTGL